MQENVAVTIIRDMTVEDVDAVLEIDKLSFPTAWARASYLLDLSNPNCFYLVVERERKVVGYGGMWVIKEEAHITTVAIYPDFRRQGLAQQLLKEMIGVAIERGAQMMTLEVRTANYLARRLYESYGFTPIGQVKHYYLDTGEDALVMSLNPLHLPRD